MRNSLYLIIFSLALAGCGADQPPAATDAPASKNVAATVKSPSHVARPAPAGMDSALKVVSSNAPTSVRYDRIVQDKTSAHVRQVFVEMLGASTAQTEALATKALASSGFSAHRGKADENGIRLQYRKKGAEPVNVLIRDKKASPPLKAAQATASLYLRQKVR